MNFYKELDIELVLYKEREYFNIRHIESVMLNLVILTLHSEYILNQWPQKPSDIKLADF